LLPSRARFRFAGRASLPLPPIPAQSTPVPSFVLTHRIHQPFAQQADSLPQPRTIAPIFRDEKGRGRLLFAALNYLEGKLITRLATRHRHQEWLAFLKLIDEQSPAGLDIHIIADNYATHKHPQVKKWLERHARFHMHYTPTSSSWMNLVERFFGDLTAFISEKSFASTRELADAIITFLAARNDNPRRYVWKAKGEDILRKIDAARRALAADPVVSNSISETAH
jgi:transposase